MTLSARAGLPAEDRPERVFRVDRHRRRGIELALLFVLVAMVATTLFFVDAWELWPKFESAIRRDPRIWAFSVVMLIVTPVLMWAERRWSERARLYVGHAGLRLESGLPRWLQLGGVMRDWQLRWDEITSIAVAERFGILQLQKRGRFSQRLVLRLSDWIDDVTAGEIAPARAERSGGRFALWQELADRGVFAQQHAADPLSGLNFDLAKHPTTRSVLFALAALAIYASVDALIARESWVDYSVAYFVPHLVAGLIGGALVGWLLTSSVTPTRVPTQVTLTLGLLMAVVAGTATYFALVRVNQAFAGDLESRSYVRNAACDALLPIDAGLPPVEYSELARGYWCQFPAEQRHQVLIRRGLFGMYQVDLTPHTEAIRAFRRGERNVKL